MIIQHRTPRLILAALVSTLLVSTTTEAQSPAAAAAAERRARMETLTMDLASRHAEFVSARIDAKARRGHRVTATAAVRAQEMQALIEADPAEALRLAIPAEMREQLPEDARNFVEAHVDLEGEVEVVSEDYAWGARVRHYLRANGRIRSVNFASDPPELQSGDHVRMSGIELADGMAVDGASVQLVTTALPYTFGEQKALWILVNFQDKVQQPYTPAAAQAMLFTTVNNFYKENSQSQTWFTGDVTNWFTIPMSSTVCDAYTLRTQAQQAASAAGWDLTKYKRFVYGFPSNACTWWGLGLIGGSTSYAMVNGSIALRVVGHELGHNMGLYHAHALECGATTLGSGCTTVEYGDPVDIMGISGVVGHFNAYAKERMGWLNYGSSLPILTVNGSGTYQFDPYASTTYGPKALKILKETDPSTGKRTHYYVEYRRGINGDSALASNTNLANGVVVHTGSEANTNSSYVLDMTPETTSWSDPALTVGRVFADAAAGVTLTTVSTGTAGASLNVQTGSFPCVPQAPTVTFAPGATQWGAAGSTVNWTMTVANRDASGCPAASFAVSGQAPFGWSATPASSVLSIAPGATASTAFAVTSATGTPDGFHTVTGTATSELSSSASVTYAVMSSYAMSVSTNAMSYATNQTATVSVGVTSAGGGLASVPVTVVITKPNGQTVTRAVTTGATGTASFTHKILKKDPVGIWAVTATGTVNGLAAQAQTTFTVK